MLKKHISKCTVFQQKQKIKIQAKQQTLSPPEKTKRVFKQELDRIDVIHGMARLIYNYVQRNEQFLKPRYPNFPGPRLFNSTEPEILPPQIESIQTFIQSIFDKRRTLHVESGIIALILLNRTKIKIHSHNWMRLVLISLLLANKHCEDVYSVYNAKFVGLVPNLENLEINILELEFLKFLKYRLHIETKTYERYYSKLQKFFPVEFEQISVESEQTSVEYEQISVESEQTSVEVEQISVEAEQTSVEDDLSTITEESPEITPNHENENSITENTEEITEAIDEDEDGYSELCPVIDTGDGSWQDYNFALVDSIA
jgi:hypothetical protein